MSKKKPTIWDAAEYLEIEEDMALHLDFSLAKNDLSLVAVAFGGFVCARGMTEGVRERGLSRESFYRALSPEGNPKFDTVMKDSNSFDLKFHVSA